MLKRNTAVPEKDFQTVTNEYAKHLIKNMREELDSEESRERIMSEGALEVSVRSDWYSAGGTQDDASPVEYRILLGTGGPVNRSVGELHQHGQPTNAQFQHHEWHKTLTA